MVTRRAALWMLASVATAGAMSGRPVRVALAEPPVFPLPPAPIPVPDLPAPPVNPTGFHSPPIRPFVDALPIPEIRSADGTVTARSGSHRFHRDLPPTQTLGYDQDHLGPVLEARSGEKSELSIHNGIGAHPLADDIDTTMRHATEFDRSDPRMTVHLHGAPTAPASDGHPMANWRKGGTQHNTYDNRQEAATLWYHDHAMGITRLNIYAGLAGPYLVRDQWDTGRADNPLGLPTGEFEVPLLIQDRTFNADGSLQARTTFLLPQGYNQSATFGDVACVNGIAWPTMTVARGRYRFRIVQGSNSRTYRFRFSNNMPFLVIGTDQGLLDAPVRTTSIRLGAGERADILVDFGDLSAGESVELCNDEPNAIGNAIFLVPALPTIMRFTAGTSSGHRAPAPTRLRGGTGLPPRLPELAEPERVRTMTLLTHLDTARPGAVLPGMLSQNNLPFTTDDVEMIRPGTVERWDIVNITGTEHPIHLHLAKFRVLGRQPFWAGSYLAAHLPIPEFGTRWNPCADSFVTAPQQAPEPWESGWKDTVLAPTDCITRILVYWPTIEELGFDPDLPFRAPGDHATHGHHGGTDGQTLQGYIWHCHNLDHEDHDMMLPFRITDN